MQLENKIKHLRKLKNMTQAELYEQLGIRDYSDYEDHIKNPDINFLKRLSSIFNVSVDYLIDNCYNYYNSQNCHKESAEGASGEGTVEKPKEIASDENLVQCLEALIHNKGLQLLLKEAQKLKPSTIKIISDIAKAIDED